MDFNAYLLFHVALILFPFVIGGVHWLIGTAEDAATLRARRQEAARYAATHPATQLHRPELATA